MASTRLTSAGPRSRVSMPKHNRPPRENAVRVSDIATKPLSSAVARSTTPRPPPLLVRPPREHDDYPDIAGVLAIPPGANTRNSVSSSASPSCTSPGSANR